MKRTRFPLFLAAATAVAVPLSTRAADVPTQSFRDTHKEVKVHLGHVAQWTGQLVRQKPAEQKKTAEKIVGFFQQHILPHADWEEKSLYPVVDQLAATTEQNRLTSTMRYEHKVVGRWTDELAKETAKERPDYVAFARRADNLLGLISAHFEEEEEVLLAWADQKMSKAQFEEAVQLREGGHH
jgi:hemerythrin-like domain-containing protein